MAQSVVRADKVIEGKTKIVWAIEGQDNLVDLESKDDITAGDGKKHDVIVGKAALANQTTCNVFRLLRDCGIPVAFVEQTSPTSFRSEHCDMILYEVIARREAHGSYLKRAPHLPKGHYFPRLLVEFFLKTTGRKWGGHDLLCDDPFIRFGDNRADLFLPSQPIVGEPFLSLDDYPCMDSPEAFAAMEELTRRTFLVLEKAWQLQGRRLVDFKIEFGVTHDSRLVVADVIDNDSWRVTFEGQYEDKQVYRDGGNLNEVTKKYQRVAEMTGHFALPKQAVYIWRGSDKDNVDKLLAALTVFVDWGGLYVEVVTCSMHKEAVRGIARLGRIEQKHPDAVLISFIGMSNGAGPTLSAHTMLPNLTVPASWKDTPVDVWSSLRTPSDVPVSVNLSLENAVLQAVQILAQRNPRLYMKRRLQIEQRLTNFVVID